MYATGFNLYNAQYYAMFFLVYLVCNANINCYQMQKKGMNKHLNNALFNKQIPKKVVGKLFKSNTMDWCIYWIVFEPVANMNYKHLLL